MKLFKDITAEEIKQECILVEDLLQASLNKASLLPVARLVAIMTLEKTLRHILYAEYKTITKIKFSVLIDKGCQCGYMKTDIAEEFRKLKEYRNASAHHGLMLLDTIETYMPVNEIIQHIHDLLDNFALTKEG
ncbi:hypothetical protein [Cytophaga hutchinsonii]|jgi:hypothetical protein|nr:hypothetical protein [Cytophaga hutchinsonii]SFX41940.1 hypothetical protein SAMN04487930_1042 [Cytophaga hutchinsonii ATCC 33406]